MGNKAEGSPLLISPLVGVVLILVFISPIVGMSIEEKILQPTFKFGGLNVDAEHQLNRPADFIVLEDKIVVSDTDDNCIVVYDKEGNLLRRIGREGQGPGEFIKPRTLGMLDDNLIVTDAQNSRIQVITWAGECISTYPAPALVSIGARLWFAQDGSYYFNSNGYMSHNIILHKTIEGEDVSGYGQIFGEKMSRVEFGGDLMKKGRVPDWYKNKVVPLGNDKGELYCIHTALPIIKKFSQEGSIIFEKTYDLSEMVSIREKWIKANKEAPPMGSYGLAYWLDVGLDEKGALYLLVNNSRMILYRLDGDGNITNRYLGVEDKIAMLHIYKQELWALGGDSHIFYKYSLLN